MRDGLECAMDIPSDQKKKKKVLSMVIQSLLSLSFVVVIGRSVNRREEKEEADCIIQSDDE